MRGAILTAAAAAVILTACGGGGGGSSSSTPAPTPSAAGLYTGTTDTNRQTSVLVLDDGRVYSLYAVAGNPNIIAGGVVGTSSSSNGSISGSGLDYNLEGQGVNAVNVSGTYTAKASIQAAISYSNGSKVNFTGKYDSSYDTTPTQATVTGTFKGTSATNLGTDPNVSMTADANGSITGTGTGCAFTGSIKPHASGNVYDVTINFGAGSCAYPNTAATGVALLSGTTMRAELQTPAKAGVLFVGTKQ